MKFSEQWLRSWVNPAVDTDGLCEQLTSAGLEVDSVEPVAGEFSGVVVADVLTVERHPNADKLSVCRVSDGSAEHQVVCGAPNVRAGIKVAFAKVGAVLPGDFAIRKAKLRGVESFGMLCSEDELGIGDDDDGIVELDATLAVGEDLREALNLDDVSIDLDLTPNRGDCFCVRGVAREVGVLNRAPISAPAIEPVAAEHDDVFPVVLDDPEGCPRYLGRVIRDIDISRPTPEWMVERLRRSGLRTIDPVVDVTNYLLLELGQPMHAFDLDVLRDRIVVRRAARDEKMTLLDGREVELDSDTLAITDGTGPVAIAGVMGGEHSGVGASTRHVFLECAFFAPLRIMGTARKYGLHTDASLRYERGVDHALQFDAMERATRLLLDVVGGSPGPVVESAAKEHLPMPRSVTLREDRLTHLVGETIPAQTVLDILTRLDLQPEASDVGWTVTVPTHRFDIEIEEDLVEEVCRIYGYNEIGSRAPVTDLGLKQVARDRAEAGELKRVLVDLGYQEAITYSFVSPHLHDLFVPNGAPVKITNPMSAEQSAMRMSLFPGLVEAVRGNIARQAHSIRLFEYGQCFNRSDSGLAQGFRIGGAIWGRREAESWASPADEVDFYDAKGDVEQLAGIGGRAVAFEAAHHPALHPGQTAHVIVDGETIGVMGMLHPELQQQLDIDNPIYLFECEAQPLEVKRTRRHGVVSKFPSVRRDLALVVKRETLAVDVERSVRSSLGEILVEFTLFDVYHGKGIDSNEKSLGVGLTFQDASRTLTDAEIATLMEETVASLQRDVGARLR